MINEIIKNFYEKRKIERGLKTRQIGLVLQKIFGMTKKKTKQIINNPVAHTIGTAMKKFTRSMAVENGFMKKVTTYYIDPVRRKINAPFKYLHDNLRIQMGLWAHTPLLVLLAQKMYTSDEEGIIAKSLKNIKENIDQIIDMLILSPGKRVYERSKNGQIAMPQSDLDAKCIYLMNGGLQKIIDRLGSLYVEIKEIGLQDKRVGQTYVQTNSQHIPETEKLDAAEVVSRSKSLG